MYVRVNGREGWVALCQSGPSTLLVGMERLSGAVGVAGAGRGGGGGGMGGLGGVGAGRESLGKAGLGAAAAHVQALCDAAFPGQFWS